MQYFDIQNYVTIDPLIAGAIFLLVLAGVSVLYLKIDTVLRLLSKYLNIHIETDIDRFKLPIIITLSSIVVLVGVSFISISPNLRNILTSSVMTVIILVWTKGAIDFGKLLLKPLITAQYDADLAPIIGNIWTICALVTSIGTVLFIWNVNITPLLASAGVVGIVAGFAARDTIANFFGSISLYADETYRNGDFIELDEQTRGVVIDVSIRSTQIQTLDGDVVTIPNSKLNNTIVKNKSQPNKNHRLKIPFGVEYGSDLEQVKEIAEEVIETVDRVQGQPVPQVHITDFGDSAIKFEVLCYINHPRHKYLVTDEIYTRLYNNFQDSGIGIPFPQRDVYLTEKS